MLTKLVSLHVCGPRPRASEATVRLLNRHHVSRIDFHRSRLLDQTHAEDQTMPLLFTKQNPVKPLERPSDDFDLHALLKIGMRIIRKDARDQGLDRRDFLVRNWFWTLPAAHNIDDADGLEDRQLLI